MDPKNIHNRVLEIEKQIETSTPEQKLEMINELFELASKIEQSLDTLKNEINEE
jgi:hypothetical protein